MFWIMFLLAVYGIVFMLKNRWELESLREFEFFENLLDCAFCLGFWVGGSVWTVVQMFSNLIMDTNSILAFLFFGLLWSFASAAFCYVVDKAVERWEWQ